MASDVFIHAANIPHWQKSLLLSPFTPTSHLVTYNGRDGAQFSAYTHTHTHTNTHTYMYTHKHTYTHTYTHKHTHTYTHKHTYITHACKHTYTHIHTLTDTQRVYHNACRYYCEFRYLLPALLSLLCISISAFSAALCSASVLVFFTSPFTGSSSRPCTITEL